MLFTVIIPTCNRNEQLENCLYKIDPERQSLSSSEYEVIVTDDGHANQAEKMIPEKFPSIKWIAGPKKGPAANRNNGAKIARGKWLVFLDDDCLPNEDILENYSQLITSNPGIRVFEGGIEREGNMKSPIYKAPGNTRTNGGFLLSCNFAIERALFDELNGFDENFKYPHLEDYDLRDRILAINEPILFTLEAKVVHPWRIMKSGIKLGHFEEMSIYYNAKNGNPSALLPLLKCITISHLLKIGWFVKHLKLSADILTAFKIMFQHLAIVGLNFNKWEKKYY